MNGPFEQSYELQTNDPQNRIIKVTAAGTVKPLPAFAKRITTADISAGEIVAGFLVWPTVRPVIPLARGEKLDIFLRLKPEAGSTSTLALAPGAPPICKLRYDKPTNTYWLDITAGPSDVSAKRAIPLVVTDPHGAAIKLTVNLAVEVPSENLVASPRELDLGEISLSALKAGQQKTGRIGLRKLVGTFHLKKLSSSLSFLKLESQTIVDGSNYLIRTRFDLAALPKPGVHNGILSVDTDDGENVKLPIKLTIVDR
jgi:hypothetical protein